jgi:hypothetical protein
MIVELALTASLAMLQSAGWGEPEIRIESAGDTGGPRFEIGEPFTIELSLSHGPDVRPELAGFEREADGVGLGPGPFTPDAGWAWFAGVGFRVQALDSEPYGLRSVARLELAALEPSWVETEQGVALDPRRVLPALAVSLRDRAGNEVDRWEAPELEIEVASLLAPDELAPRPLSGLYEPPPALEQSSAWTRAIAIAAVSLALLSFGVASLLRGSRSEPLPPLPLTPRERLQRARERRAGGLRGRDAVELAYELSALVREAASEAFAAAGPSATDEEWLQSISSLRLEAQKRAELERFFQRLARIKYAGEAPSTWAVDELLAEAGAWLERAESGGESGGRAA